MAMKPDEKRSELLDSLVDIRDVRIDRSQPVEERNISGQSGQKLSMTNTII